MLRHMRKQPTKNTYQSILKSETVKGASTRVKDETFISFLQTKLSPESYATLESHWKSLGLDK